MAKQNAPKSPRPQSGYAPVNGLNMYYESHGTGKPLVLVHGAFSGVGTSFGLLMPGLAKTRRVIAVEMQGHGRTADIERPLTLANLGDDIVALLAHLEIDQADLFGYSLGSGVALDVAVRRPDAVRKLVLASPGFSRAGLHPGLLDGMEALQPEHLAGSPFHEEYIRLAPRPEDFPALVAKIKAYNAGFTGWPAEAVQGLKAPALIVIGDSDIVRPEHAVEMFRLLGGGVIGDMAGLPNSQLAVLPGTTHVTLVHRAEWLVPMISAFLDAPMPQGEA